jgi:hypothetical protein
VRREGKVPRLGIVVSVREAYTQCPKAMIRSDLWNPGNHVQRDQLPSHGAILKSLALASSIWPSTSEPGRSGARAATGFTDAGRARAHRS